MPDGDPELERCTCQTIQRQQNPLVYRILTTHHIYVPA